MGKLVQLIHEELLPRMPGRSLAAQPTRMSMDTLSRNRDAYGSHCAFCAITVIQRPARHASYSLVGVRAESIH